jgi:ferritin-like metal-binding protein YciE
MCPHGHLAVAESRTIRVLDAKARGIFQVPPADIFSARTANQVDHPTLVQQTATLAAVYPDTHVKRQQGEALVGLFSKDIGTMNDLFLHTLADIYYAEQQIVKSLPDMVKKATNPQLKQGFETHLRETENHVKRLEQVFQKLDVKAKGVDCPAIDGILKEAKEVAGEVSDKSVLDAALVAAAQAVEHYEMTRYGTLIAWAKQLGRQDVVGLLQQTLEEEKATDKKLTSVAEASVNRKAA